ncbi:M23 family metallopeptidase [Leifsonia shinshuensis]|uniref:M23 family metallopeptidase n=1 Tax=Leifsonia shinshuensis TaxID=150026 RepID=UPI001F50F18E|nr:M23 family metallopeptidase [Leifsonia shinshuensis]MCI0155428.1 M23 family metallopeptidase [Leifsonia shinshuensis]
MLRFTPFSHTLTATGLVLGLAATSTLTVTVTPAAAVPATVSTTAESLAAQDLVVGADGDGAVFGIARDQWGVLVPPTVVWPVQGGSVSDGFGHREAPTEGASTDHQGVDFAARHGEPVRTAATGVVSSVVSEDRGGCGVNIAIDHVVRGQNVTTVYCHLAAGSVRVAPGQSVVVGDTIAAVGNTGTSTGAHLHFEVRPNGGAAIDPLSWLGALAA